MAKTIIPPALPTGPPGSRSLTSRYLVSAILDTFASDLLIAVPKFSSRCTVEQRKVGGRAFPFGPFNLPPAPSPGPENGGIDECVAPKSGACRLARILSILKRPFAGACLSVPRCAGSMAFPCSIATATTSPSANFPPRTAESSLAGRLRPRRRSSPTRIRQLEERQAQKGKAGGKQPSGKTAARSPPRSRSEATWKAAAKTK